MASSQLSMVLGRRLPSSEEAAIRAKAPYLYSSLAAQDQREYQDKALALSAEGLAQSADYNTKALGLQKDAQEEAMRQAKKAELTGYADLGLQGGMGALKYGDSIKSALGIGADAAPGSTGAMTAANSLGVKTGVASLAAPTEGGAAGAVGAPSAGSFAPAVAANTSAQQSALAGLGIGAAAGSAGAANPSIITGFTEAAAPIEAGSQTGVPAAVSGAPSASAASGLTGGQMLGAAGIGFGAGSIASKIGGGTEGGNKAIKGALGGAAAGAAYGMVLGGGVFSPITTPVATVIGAVTGAIGGGSRVICTKLANDGLLDKELHAVEAEWSMANKSHATIRGYHAWAVPFVRFMEGRPRFCKAVAWAVTPYAKYLAHRAGSDLGRFTVAGFMIDKIGTAVCWCIGNFVKYDKVHPLWDREDSGRHQGVCNG